MHELIRFELEQVHLSPSFQVQFFFFTMSCGLLVTSSHTASHTPMVNVFQGNGESGVGHAVLEGLQPGLA